MQKKFKRLDNFFFWKKARTLLFYILLMWLLQKKGHVRLLKKLYRKTLNIPCSKRSAVRKQFSSRVLQIFKGNIHR